jgi:hypothetical protein
LPFGEWLLYVQKVSPTIKLNSITTIGAMGENVIKLFVHDALIGTEYVDKQKMIWCVMWLEGVDRPVATKSVEMARIATFDSRVSLVSESRDVSDCYIYMRVCSFGATESDLISIGQAKTRISALPLGGPHAFRVPLFSAEKKSSARRIGSLVLSGELIRIQMAD